MREKRIPEDIVQALNLALVCLISYEKDTGSSLHGRNSTCFQQINEAWELAKKINAEPTESMN